jgi:hypothetical protein
VWRGRLPVFISGHGSIGGEAELISNQDLDKNKGSVADYRHLGNPPLFLPDEPHQGCPGKKQMDFQDF